MSLIVLSSDVCIGHTSTSKAPFCEQSLFRNVQHVLTTNCFWHMLVPTVKDRSLWLTYKWRHHVTRTWHVIKCKCDQDSKSVKGTPLRSGRVTHLKRNFSKTCFYLLSTCVGHNRLSCGTLIDLCLLSVINSFKTGIIYVDFGSEHEI